MRLPRHIRPYGPSALLLEWEPRIDERISRSVHAYAAAIADHPAITECVPGYASLLIMYRPEACSAYTLREYVYGLSVEEGDLETGRQHLIPVLYGGAWGPDLDAVAVATGNSAQEVIDLHAGREYLVYMLGFRPGFAFLGPTDERLRVDRRPSPRDRVPGGAVGLAGQQTGIYPGEGPGGWQLIGRCPLPLLDGGGHPRLRAGDRVRFQSVDEATFFQYQDQHP
ncbi:5-oxoprolinase subunit PxpB [Neolewinella litorea]|uniref:5-oxoprolinase subunit PxpB n=1 Tax=Neolewinella litorea TaxID=2562452 RepID=A0A4S4NPP4_9BACT|nr:5-oxoprolinase subunit PxpB [Neolewinella litorea]THH42026.1 5-oxoprolinase subunit PxpB [Neolewinella litorea]